MEVITKVQFSQLAPSDGTVLMWGLCVEHTAFQGFFTKCVCPVWTTSFDYSSTKYWLFKLMWHQEWTPCFVCRLLNKIFVWEAATADVSQFPAASQCLGGTTGLARRFPCHFQLQSSSSNLACRILFAQYHAAWKRSCVKSKPPLLSCGSFLKNVCTCAVSLPWNGWQEQKKGGRKDCKLLL